MNTDIEQVSQALTDYSKVEAGLAALREQFGGVVYDVTTTVGMDAAKQARMTVREPRFEIERVRKAAKSPLLALGKRIDSEAARITTELLKIEEPIDAQIKAEENRKEAERQAKVAAELKRVQDIQERIGELRGAIAAAAHADSALILEHIADLERVPVDESFAEFRQSADDAKAATLAKLREMHTATVAREAEAARIKAEREELAKLRAEQEARDATARAERAEADRKAAAERAAEQEARDREFRARQAEQDRLERERKATADAEAKRLADERAELERREAAIREAEKPKPAGKVSRGVKRPTDLEIVQVVANHFGVGIPTATKWLSELSLKAA